MTAEFDHIVGALDAMASAFDKRPVGRMTGGELAIAAAVALDEAGYRIVPSDRGPTMNWRQIVIGVIDEDEEFGEPLDPPVDYTLGQLVDEMRSLGSVPERAAWFRAKDPGRRFEGIEWDTVIESIVHALETAPDAVDEGPSDG